MWKHYHKFTHPPPDQQTNSNPKLLLLLLYIVIEEQEKHLFSRPSTCISSLLMVRRNSVSGKQQPAAAISLLHLSLSLSPHKPIIETTITPLHSGCCCCFWMGSAEEPTHDHLSICFFWASRRTIECRVLESHHRIRSPLLLGQGRKKTSSFNSVKN